MEVREVEELLESRKGTASATFGALAEEASKHEHVKRRSQFKASVHG